MLPLFLFLLGCGLAFSVEVQKQFYKIDIAEDYFNDFVHTYNKQYSSDRERNQRLQIFTDNLKRINRMNAVDTARYGINQFADLSEKEFLSTHTGYISPKGLQQSVCTPGAPSLLKQAPDSFDWRSKNVVSPVKNQLRCGSCYAFSTTGNIESQYAIHKNGVILDLSEQELVDCSQENSKCGGGWMTQAMTDIINLGGIETESNYPYLGVPGANCNFDKSMVKVTLSGCTDYRTQDEGSVKEILFETGPLSIALAASALNSYQGGVITNCPGDVNHAVLLVGYGSENGQDYWIIKNSWGEWGENGYFRIARGQNTCQLMQSGMSVAVVA